MRQRWSLAPSAVLIWVVFERILPWMRVLIIKPGPQVVWILLRVGRLYCQMFCMILLSVPQVLKPVPGRYTLQPSVLTRIQDRHGDGRT